MTSLHEERQAQCDVVNALLNDGEFFEAEEKLNYLLAQDPECVSYYELLGGALRGQGRQLELVPILSSASKNYPALALARGGFPPAPGRICCERITQCFLNTQFKSGSVFLRGALENGLGLGWQFLFPEGLCTKWWISG